MAPQDLIASKPKTKADFYAFIASEPEGRWEFEQGHIVAMPGGTLRHAKIGARILRAIA